MIRTSLLKFCMPAAVFTLGASFAFAQGGGSLGLDEILETVKADPKLTAEINGELKTNNLKAETVVCSGFRHGHAWPELSGARAAPYTCDIGKRRLTIEADRIYFDAKGKPLGDMKKANKKRADSFKESNFRWQWKPNDKPSN
jgi:hypothetical protein